ncbi:hypothetical protein HPB47_017202 [Ixodes persulcatus]|uniref:Uncharacterized protein n=1 Tax=Ixodes persulcatus TaxID=34615 RepID=A0AC60QRG6_IXOPE|nr:hypothetical protein HPB47_017202 [Ixodes persulcatus]
MQQEMKLQNILYSPYKRSTTMRGLVGVAPNGVVTYVSKLYPGSNTDKDIVKDCGVLKQLVPGDLLLADKGFLIRALLPPGVSLNIPPFLSTPQFTPQQVLMTKLIARAHVHVERAIGRIKGYTILEYIPVTFFSIASKVWEVCAALTNFQNPLLKEVEQFYRPKN